MIKNWVGFSTLSGREIKRFFSVWRQTVVPGVVTTLLYIFIFGVALENRISTISDIPYKIYILPGLIMMNVITNSVANSASSLLQMKLLQTLPELMITPLSSTEMSLSFILGGTVRGTVNGVLILLICVLSGMPLVNPLLTFGIIVIVSWIFSALGLIIGQVADSWDQLAVIQNFIITPLSFLGGIFYSIYMLPDWAIRISLLNPIYYSINSLRAATIGVEEFSLFGSIMIIIGCNILLSSVAIMLMNTGYRIRS